MTLSLLVDHLMKSQSTLLGSKGTWPLLNMVLFGTTCVRLVRKEKVDLLIKLPRDATNDGVVVDLGAKNDFGEEVQGSELGWEGVQGYVQLLTLVITILTLVNLTSKDESSSEKGEDKVKDFVDIMLGFFGSKNYEYHIELPNVKGIMLNMLTGSIDNSTTTIELIL
ncbi:hypothetical protein CR513_61750, partial [Mucuna pruriens]